MAAALVEWRN